MISAIPGVYELIDLCKKHGVQHVVVSPGSRNAPISLTLEHANGISTYVIPDERSAGFYALGISLAVGNPVALVCTSGSAALNYAPAVSEAYYQKIPLIVITADRPAEWINQGDGQTIMQEALFGKHVLYSATLPVVSDKDSAWWFNRMVNEALIKATGHVKGPVHLNIPFKEPLYQLKENTNTKARKITRVVPSDSTAQLEIKELTTILSSDEKVLFLAGQINNLQTASEITNLLKNQSAVLLSETTSNLHGGNVFNTIDRLIDGFTAEEKKEFAPDILITIGDAVVSKKVKAWLRGVKLKHHIHIGTEHNLLDTYQQLTWWIDSDAASVLKAISPYIKADENYVNKWNKRRDLIRKKHLDFLSSVPWSDFKVFGLILSKIDKGSIHLGNSSPIRYAQLFEANQGCNYFCNRGTSGIDGCASTAAGFSLVNKELNVLITGDISFYYDSNALWNNYIGGNLKIILINNKGGNIFRIIDGPADEQITQKYFETHQEMEASNLCAQFNVNYFKASNENELTENWSLFMNESPRPSLIELFTDNIVSPQILKDYFNALKN